MTNKQKEWLRAAKFTLFSISAGIIQAGALFITQGVLKWTEWVGYLVALVLSVLWNFTLNRKITFHSANNVPIAMLKVAAYYAVFAPLSTWGLKVLVSLGWNVALADALFMLANFVTEYLYDRFVVFGASIDTAVKKEKK